MAMWISGSFEWGRAGNVVATATATATTTATSAATPNAAMATLTLEPAGFPAVTAFPATSSTIVPTPASLHRKEPVVVVTFGSNDNSDAGTRSESGAPPTLTVGASTGCARDLVRIVAAIEAARARANVLPAHLAEAGVAALALPLFDVLAWNTLFTNSLHVRSRLSILICLFFFCFFFSFFFPVFFSYLLLGARLR